MAESTSQRAPQVLFVSATERETEGHRIYRCAYQAKQLIRAGMRAQVIHYKEATSELLDASDVLVVSRCGWSPIVVDFILEARAAGKVVCGDLDDKIFSPWDVDETGYLRSLAAVKRDMAARASFAGHERSVLRVLPLFDVVLASTPGIKDALEELGLDAHVVRNAIDTDVVGPIRREKHQLRRILIMSGTATHDADLRSIAQPLARFLYENPQLECSLLGQIEPPGPLRGLANLKRCELLPLSKLYGFVGEHDLCLVPLEASTFNDCKSALKFIECGLVSVPVIASPRREFREVMRDRETGFLADDEPESWYRTLCMVKEQPDLLRRVAAAAHRAVIAEHTVASRGTQLADYLRSLKAAADARPAVVEAMT